MFSVPLMGFLLYFLTLISTITLRWQRRETAIMVSRGMRVGQLLGLGVLEAIIVVGLGGVLGLPVGVQVAQWMGYTKSFMSFTWREPLPVSFSAFNAPMVAATVSWPLLRPVSGPWCARRGPALSRTNAGVRAHRKGPFGSVSTWICSW